MIAKRTHSSVSTPVDYVAAACFRGHGRVRAVLLRMALGLLALLLLAGCELLPLPSDGNETPLAMRTLGPYPSFTPAPSVTPKNTPTTAPSITPSPTNTPTPSVTPSPTRTLTPTNTPTVTPMPIEALPGTRASVASAQQEVAKVVVQVFEVRLLPYESAFELNKPLFSQGAFRLVQTVGVLSVSVENKSKTTVRIAPNKGVLVIGDEQVELERFIGYSDNVGGDLLPGIIRDGFLLFGAKRYAPEEINSIRLVLSAPASTLGRPLSPKGYDIKVALK